ncbi:hypothetical protein BGZ65_002018, partial [Modicella reniformis]
MAKAFHGRVEDTVDALIILEACRQGVLPKINRRLLAAERGEVQDHTIVKSEDVGTSSVSSFAPDVPSLSTSIRLFPGDQQSLVHPDPPISAVEPSSPSLITPGSVFVFDEDESKICRWTDGRIWSPSRISGNFLIYRELFRKLSNEKCLTSREKAKMKNGSGLKDKALKEKVEKDNLVVMGCMKGTFVLKKDGLIKKTICVKGMNLPSPEEMSSRGFRGRGRTNKRRSDDSPPGFSEAGIQHLVCYEKSGAMDNLHRPREYAELLNLPLSRTFVSMQKYRNPMRILPLAPGVQPIEPFDEYVSNSRIVEGRVSEGEATFEKDQKPRTKRTKTGRVRCCEKDDEGNKDRTSGGGGSSSDDSNGFSGHSKNRPNPVPILNHSYPTRGQDRQMREAEQRRLHQQQSEREHLNSLPNYRRKRAFSDRGASTQVGPSKRRLIQREGDGDGDLSRCSSLVDEEEDAEEETHNLTHPFTTAISIQPASQSSLLRADDNLLAVRGVKTDGQWRVLPTPASLQIDVSGFPHYESNRMTLPESSQDYAIQRDDQVHEGHGIFVQGAGTRQGRITNRNQLGRITNSHIGADQPSHEAIGAREYLSSPLSSPIPAGWSSGSLSSRNSLSSSYSLSPALAPEEFHGNNPVLAGPPLDSVGTDYNSNKIQGFEFKCGASTYSSPPDEYTNKTENGDLPGDSSPSDSLYHSISAPSPNNHSHGTLRVEQECEFEYGAMNPVEPHIQFTSSIASRYDSVRVPQLMPISTNFIFDQSHSHLPHFSSISGTLYSVAPRSPEPNAPQHMQPQDHRTHDRPRSFLDAITARSNTQGTRAAKVDPGAHKKTLHLPTSAQSSNLGPASPHVEPHLQDQDVTQDSCTTSFSLPYSFQNNSEGQDGRFADKHPVAFQVGYSGEYPSDFQQILFPHLILTDSQFPMLRGPDSIHAEGNDKENNTNGVYSGVLKRRNHVLETHSSTYSMAMGSVEPSTLERNGSFKQSNELESHSFSGDSWSAQWHEGSYENQESCTLAIANASDGGDGQSRQRKRQRTRVEQQ